MGSTFSGIELGKRSIMAHTDAITTAGHNISNASTEGYSRQRVNMKEFDPLYRPDLERESILKAWSESVTRCWISESLRFRTKNPTGRQEATTTR